MMLQLCFFILSYGALLLLLMPPTGTGILSVAALLAIGIGLIVHTKVYKKSFWEGKKHLLSVAVFAVVCLGLVFYHRWLPSSKMQAIAAMLHMSIETLLSIGSVLLSLCSVYVLFAGLQIIAGKIPAINQKTAFIRNLLSCVIAAVVTVILAQIMIDMTIFSMGLLNFLWGVLIVSVVILFLYCLLGKVLPSIYIGAGIFMVISTINAYVYQFRQRLFEPVDIFSVGTAMNVAENYSLLPVPRSVLEGWGVFLSLLICFFCLLHKQRTTFSFKKRLALLTVCATSVVAIFFYASGLKTHHWHREGARNNGYLLDFVSKFKEISAQEPDNYSAESIAQLAAQYSENNLAVSAESPPPPHIIVIMDEAFSDLQVNGDFPTNTEVMPFISSLKENTISGYALSSVYGGNTANSEYEFLTGNSLAWLSPNVVPYQQYIRSSTYSMVSYLKSAYNYKCIAMHPFEATGWNRPVAYSHLGFDACYFIEDFPQKDYIRNFISDKEMFEFLIETYEQEKDVPLFLFGVTMQNHGDYTYTGERYTQHISLENCDGNFPEVEQYLSLIHETDKAVEDLIAYFEAVDENVLIVFFGDHQPKIDESFYETVSGTAADSLDQQQQRFKIPFFVWANYDIDEERIDCTSLNYLSSYVYRAAGIALPPYNQFLQEMETAIPSINANGFYSLRNNCYTPFDEASQEEQQWLNLYEALQYNSIFDKTYRDKTFFPALE